MAIQMRRGNLADFDPTKMMPGEFAVTLDADNNLNKRVLITFAAGTVKQLMTVEDATAQMIEATDAATAEAEAWAHGNSFTATEMFTSAGSATVTLAYSPSSINAVKINDVATTAYTRNGKVITFNTAPAVGSIITVIYGVSTSTDNAKYYKGQAANSASTASTKATQASTSATNAANSATTASTKATQAGNSATLSESYAVGGTGTRPGEDTDNAKYYKDQMAAYLSGIYHFIGSVNKYADLPTMGMVRGDTYDILTADPTHEIAAGDNVAWTGTKWDKLAGTIAIMIGATASSNGAKGLVPAPMIADREKYLRGDGTWANPNTAVDDVYSVMGKMGAKNLFNSQYSVPRTNIGTTSTLGDYGHIIINGTANADGAQLNQSIKGILPIYDLKVGDKLIISYKVISGTFTQGSSSSKTVLYINDKNGNSIQPSIKFPSSLSTGDSGSEEIILDNNCFDNGVFKSKDLQLYIRNGNTFNNLELAIMVRLASDTDNTYQPYAKTNKQLTEDKAELESVSDYVNKLGVKNLIPYPYNDITRTTNGITFTDNGDGTVTVNGTATGNVNFWCIRYEEDFIFPEGKYILSDGGVGSDNVNLFLANYNGSTWKRQYDVKGNREIAVTVQHSGDYNRTPVGISVKSGTVVNNLTFKPMLRLASDTDNTYRPYAKTNKELTNGIDDVYKTMGEMGAKNLIPYPYYETTHTENGVTFTDNGDGTVTANTGGSASTGSATFFCGNPNNVSNLIKLDKNKTYIFSDTTHSGIANNCVVGIRYFAEGVVPSTTSGTNASCNESNNWQVTVTNAVYAYVYVYVWSGKTVSNITLKPLLRLAADTDNTYQPYAKTNKELTEVIGDLSKTSVTGATVAAQLGVLGNILSFTHFVQIPFTTSVLDSIKAAFENNTIPVDIYGITLGMVRGGAGSQRVIFIAQNQKLSTTQTRYAAIYFGAYTAPRFLQKQDGTDWTDVAL